MTHLTQNHRSKCFICPTILTGKQKKFCSRNCRNMDINNRHKSYVQQQFRGWERKRLLIESLGGECERCGYKVNLAALCFHHKNPSEKRFQLDIRACSNNSLKVLIEESEKCKLLCHNCHMELHHPNHILNP